MVLLGPTDPLIRVAVADVNGDGRIARDGSGDEDGDTLTDADEVLVFETDPCLADTDADGLNDNLDQCPSRGLEETGFVDLLGCPS